MAAGSTVQGVALTVAKASCHESREENKENKEMESMNRSTVLVLFTLAGLYSAGIYAQDAAQESEDPFGYRERSTMDTIPFQSLEEESLANTIIEGGLEAPAAGVPVAETEEDFYLDPLALQPSDNRTDLGRSEIPVEIRFSNPRVIPGQVNGNTYSIQPSPGRTYNTYGANVTTR